ncbi:MAG: helix-turn-helix domain-containing protein [Pseudolabrys sp.]
MLKQATATKSAPQAHSTQYGAVFAARRTDANPLDILGASMPFVRNVEIYGEDDPADYFYKVVSGMVRTCKILSDGRRQINAFYGPGEFFGLEVNGTHTLSAEAVEDTIVLVIKRSTIVTLANSDSQVARQLWLIAARELQRMQDRALLLVKSARERVAGFLLEMASRREDDAVELPMSRQDIADHLGLTIETVSRTLTQLTNAAAIALPSARHIVLRNRDALALLNA